MFKTLQHLIQQCSTLLCVVVSAVETTTFSTVNCTIHGSLDIGTIDGVQLEHLIVAFVVTAVTHLVWSILGSIVAGFRACYGLMTRRGRYGDVSLTKYEEIRSGDASSSFTFLNTGGRSNPINNVTVMPKRHAPPPPPPPPPSPATSPPPPRRTTTPPPPPKPALPSSSNLFTIYEGVYTEL